MSFTFLITIPFSILICSVCVMSLVSCFCNPANPTFSLPPSSFLIPQACWFSILLFSYILLLISPTIFLPRLIIISAVSFDQAFMLLISGYMSPWPRSGCNQYDCFSNFSFTVTVSSRNEAYYCITSPNMAIHIPSNDNIFIILYGFHFFIHISLQNKSFFSSAQPVKGFLKLVFLSLDSTMYTL